MQSPSPSTVHGTLWDDRPPAWGAGRYLLVQEHVPSQEAVLPAQQHPVARLGLSPAAGLGHLVAVQSQEPENGGKLEVIGPVDPTATELGGEQRKGLVGGAEGTDSLATGLGADSRGNGVETQVRDPGPVPRTL